MARGGLFRHRDFRLLWGGETVSELGSQVSILAIPLVAVRTLHATTFEIGALTASSTAAFLLVGLPAGVWVDRLRRRRVMIAADVGRLLALGSVPVTYAFGALGLLQLYLVTLFSGFLTVFFDVAYQSYLPELIDRDLLVEGNANLQASESVSQIAGPSLGGVLIQVLTAPYAVLVDAASFLWSAAWVAAIRARAEKPLRSKETDLRREIGEGVRFVLGNPLLRAIALCTGTSNLFSSIAEAVIYVLLARQLHLSAGWIGLISSTSAVGGLIGARMATRVAARFGQGPAIWMSVLVIAPTGFVAPFVHRGWSLVALAAAQVLMWAGVVVYNITQVSFRQGLCPPALLGRMNATMRFLVWGTLPLGGFLGGVLGATIGVRETLLVVAIGGSLAFLPVYLSPLRRMRELPAFDDGVPEPVPAVAMPD
jgi:MFS family permease